MKSSCDCQSVFVENVVLLSNWYLMKSVKDHLGKSLAVGGDSVKGDHTIGTFHSAPIVQRLGTFRLKTADGFIVMLNGVIDGDRTRENGFPIEAIHVFQIGFPFTWEILADTYIGKVATASCSVGGYYYDVNEAQRNSAGRARRVRIMADDAKESRNNCFDKSGNGGSVPCSYARKFEVKTHAFLADVKLPIGSDTNKFSPSVAYEGMLKGTAGKYKVSSSGCALGSIPEFGNGRMHPEDGKRFIKSDETTISQMLSGKCGIGVMGYQSTKRGIQQNGVEDCVTIKAKGRPEAKTSQKSDRNNLIALSSASVDDSGGARVNCVVEHERSQTTCPTCMDLDKKHDNITMKVSDKESLERDGPDGSSPKVNIRDANDLVDDGLDTVTVPELEVMFPAKSRKVMTTEAPTRYGIARSIATPRRSSRLLAAQRVPCDPANHIQVAKDSVSIEDSDGKKPKYAPELISEGCNERSNSRVDTSEPIEHQSNRSLEKPVRKCGECGDSPKATLSQKKACTKSPPPSVFVMDSSVTATSNHRITRTNRSGCLWSKRKVEQKECPPVEDGEVVDITGLKDKNVHDSPIEKSVRESGEYYLNPSKHLLSHKDADTEASTLSSAVRDASISAPCHQRRRSMSKTKSDCFHGIGKGHSSLKNVNSESIVNLVDCSKVSIDGDDSKLGASELGPGKIKDQMRLDAKSYSIKRSNLSNTAKHADAKRKLQFDHAADNSGPKTSEKIASPLDAGSDRIQGQVERSSKFSDDEAESWRGYNEIVDEGKKRKSRQHPYSTGKSSPRPGTLFNLKMSSSGRLVVPPLAYWRNEQVLYDKDGSITCISDGSKVIKRSRFLGPLRVSK